MPDLDLKPGEYRERKWPREWPAMLIGIGCGLAVLGYMFLNIGNYAFDATSFFLIAAAGIAVGICSASLFRRWL